MDMGLMPRLCQASTGTRARPAVWMGMEMLKHAGMAAWLIGIAAFIGLTIWSGPHAVGHAVASVGWGILLVVMARAVTACVAGAGWWLLFPSTMRPQLRTCVLLRFIRDAVNVLVAQIGGDLIGARLLTFRGVPGPLAAASVIVDVLIQAATLFLFAMLGLLVLVALGGDETLARIAAIGLAIAALMLAGFYLAQRRGGQRLLQWAMSRLTGNRKWRVLGTIDAVYENLAMIYAARSSVAASGVLQMAGWIFGVTEVLIAFACMGNPISIAQALVIESLLHAIRGAAFAIPSALGAQEGGLVLLCAAFAIPPEQAIALSLVKRAADLVLGVPGLLGWQVLEWKRLKPDYSVPARPPAGDHFELSRPGCKVERPPLPNGLGRELDD
jgi:putative membrane protein